MNFNNKKFYGLELNRKAVPIYRIQITNQFIAKLCNYYV